MNFGMKSGGYSEIAPVGLCVPSCSPSRSPVCVAISDLPPNALYVFLVARLGKLGNMCLSFVLCCVDSKIEATSFEKFIVFLQESVRMNVQTLCFPPTGNDFRLRSFTTPVFSFPRNSLVRRIGAGGSRIGRTAPIGGQLADRIPAGLLQNPRPTCRFSRTPTTDAWLRARFAEPNESRPEISHFRPRSNPAGAGRIPCSFGVPF